MQRAPQASPVVPRKRPQTIPGLWPKVVRHASNRTLRKGDALHRFEARISNRLKGRYVAAIGSGRFALLLVLESLGVEPGSTILLPSYNASCVPNALQAAGYRPLFMDIDPETLTLDAKRLPKKLPDNTGAIIVTHIEGNPGPVEAVQKWAERFEIPVIEDAAHALGAELNGQAIGSLGDGAIFSLGRGKHLNTLGGGIAVVKAARAGKKLHALADRLSVNSGVDLLRQVMMETMVVSGTHPTLYAAIALPALKVARRFGLDPMTLAFEDPKDALDQIPEDWKRRLSNLQAELGLGGLDRFDRALIRRRQIADHMRAELAGTLPMQKPIEGANPAWLELTVLVNQREAFQKRLLKLGVDTQRTWMDACHALPGLGDEASECPHALRVGQEAVYLPTYAALSDAQVDHTIAAVKTAVNEGLV